MDKTEAEYLIGSIKQFYELEAEQSTSQLKGKLAIMTEEIERRKLREEQLEGTIKIIKSRNEQKIREIELRAKEQERLYEERLKKVKRDSQAVISRYKEEVEIVIFQNNRIQEILTDAVNGKSVKQNMKYLEDVKKNNQKIGRWQEEDLRREMENIQEERIVEKAQLNKLSRKAELYKKLAQEREDQVSNSEELIKLLSGISERVNQDANEFICEWSSLVIESIQRRQAGRIQLDNKIDSIIQSRNELEKELIDKENAWSQQEISLREQISHQSKINFSQQQEILQCKKQLDFLLIQKNAQIQQSQDYILRVKLHNQSQIKLFHQNMEDQQNKLRQYYEELLSNWKNTVKQLKSFDTQESDQQQCNKNNFDLDMLKSYEIDYSVINALEKENKQLQRQNMIMKEQISSLKCECSLKEGQIEDIKKQQDHLISNIESQLKKCNDYEIQLKQLQQQEIENSFSLKQQSTQTQHEENLIIEIPSLQLQFLNNNSHLQNSIKKLKLQPEIEINFGQFRKRAVSVASDNIKLYCTCNKNQKFQNQKTVKDEQPSTYDKCFEETIKEISLKLRSELQELATIRNMKEQDLAANLLTILEQQLEDHAKEKSTLAEQLVESRKSLAEEIKIQENIRRIQWKKEREELGGYIEKMLKFVESSQLQVEEKLDAQEVERRIKKELQSAYENKLNSEMREQNEFVNQMQKQFVKLADIHKKQIQPLSQNMYNSQIANHSSNCTLQNDHNKESTSLSIQKDIYTKSPLTSSIQTNSIRSATIQKTGSSKASEPETEPEFLTNLLSSQQFVSKKYSQNKQQSKENQPPTQVNFSYKRNSRVGPHLLSQDYTSPLDLSKNFKETFTQPPSRLGASKGQNGIQRYSMSSCGRYDTEASQTDKLELKERLNITINAVGGVQQENLANCFRKINNQKMKRFLNSSTTIDNIQIDDKQIFNKKSFCDDVITSTSIHPPDISNVSTRKQVYHSRLSQQKGYLQNSSASTKKQSESRNIDCSLLPKPQQLEQIFHNQSQLQQQYQSQQQQPQIEQQCFQTNPINLNSSSVNLQGVLQQMQVRYNSMNHGNTQIINQQSSQRQSSAAPLQNNKQLISQQSCQNERKLQKLSQLTLVNSEAVGLPLVRKLLPPSNNLRGSLIL